MGILTGFWFINAKPNPGTVQESSRSDCFSGKEMDGQTDEMRVLDMANHVYPLAPKNKIKAVKIRFLSEKQNKISTKTKLQMYYYHSSHCILFHKHG